MAEQEVLISEAELDDAKNLAILLQQLTKETDYITKDEGSSLLSEQALSDFIRQSRERIDQICLLLRVGEELAGVLNVQPIHSSSSGDVFLAIKKKYWGYGLGSYLMDTMLDWAEHTPVIERLDLSVQVRNSVAVHLYQKFGFKINSTQKKGAKTRNGDYLDIYLMSRLMES